MPGTLRVYDPTDDTLQAQADTERQTRIKAIDSWWDWREGRHPQTLKTYPGQRDDNVTVNLVGQMIDEVADFVGMPSVAVAGDAGDNNVSSALDAVRDESAFEELTGDLVESALTTGHVFVRLVEPENDEPLSAENPPTMALLDPRHVTVFWDMERFGSKKRALWYQLTWAAGKYQKRQDIVPADLLPTEGEGFAVLSWLGDLPTEGWAIIEWVKDTSVKDAQWKPTAMDLWPWEFAPIVDGKALRKPHSYYGRSFVDGVDHLNDALNFTMSNIGKILRYHAHPKTVIVNATLEEPTTGADELIEIRGTGDAPAQVYNVEMNSDLASSLEYQRRLRAATFAAGRVVDPLSVHDKVGQLTNFGLRTLYKSMLDLCDAVQGRLGAVFEEAMRRALAMMDFEASVLATWDDPLPLNRNEELQAAQVEHGLGLVSRETLAGDLGRDWETEEQRIVDESAAAGEGVVRQLELFGEQGLIA
jgi:hypothetical protein